MLLSLPWFLVSSGFRLGPKFSRDAAAAPELPEEVPLQARIIGAVVFLLYCAMGFILAYVHREHQLIFQQKYEIMWHASGMGSIMPQVQEMMAPRSRSSRVAPVDV